MFCKRDGSNPICIAPTFLASKHVLCNVRLKCKLRAAATGHALMFRHVRRVVRSCWCKVVTVLETMRLAHGSMMCSQRTGLVVCCTSRRAAIRARTSCANDPLDSVGVKLSLRC